MDSPVFQRDFARRVRIGVVGVGRHAYRTILPTLTFLPVDLVGVADIDPLLTSRTAAQYGVRGYPSADAMLAQERLDDVVPCVSPHLSFLVTVAGPVSSLTVHRGLDDSGVVVLRHENGVVSNLHLALGAAPSQPNERYTVFGDGCTVEIENSRTVWFQRGIPIGPDTTSFAAGGSNTGAVRWEAQDSMNTLDCRPEMTQGVYGSLDHFLSCILERRLPTSGTLEFARHLAQLHQAAMHSDGQSIEIGAQQ